MTEECIGTTGRGGVLVGPAGWSYPDWQGIVYPAGMSRETHPLTYLSKHFNTVEINSTFYRPARPDYAAKWVRCVEERPALMFTASPASMAASVKCFAATRIPSLPGMSGFRDRKNIQ